MDSSPSTTSVTVYEDQDTTFTATPSASDTVDGPSSSGISEDSSESTAQATIVEHDVDQKKGASKKKREIDQIKKRFACLLLGEDMSGGGKGVCSALAISNAITNLSVSVFGKHWKLEPLPPKAKKFWKKEMDLLLCITDHIIELVPSYQTSIDGNNNVEVMRTQRRRDIEADLPALRDMDDMLLKFFDAFKSPEFFYVKQEHVLCSRDSESEASFKEEGKWWHPVPRVPPQGLSEKARKELQMMKKMTSQQLMFLRTANADAINRMESPISYMEGLPKNGKEAIGDAMYRFLSNDDFSPDNPALNALVDLSNERDALELINRLEACIHVWRNKQIAKETDKRKSTLIMRAEKLIISVRLKVPGLPQSALDIQKIQYNKDVGHAILESYSRVLEGLAFNILASIDGVLNADYRQRLETSSFSTCSEELPLVASPSYSALPSFSSTTSADTQGTLGSRRQKGLSLFSPGKTLADFMRVDPFSKRLLRSANASGELESGLKSIS